MTTRRGEPIETERQTVADILRPLAEATVECPSCLEPVVHHKRCQGTGRIPDPRFEAIRRGNVAWTERQGTEVINHVLWGGIDASLGAIVRAAAACGYHAIVFDVHPNLVTCRMWPDLNEPQPQSFGVGDTVEEAASRALVAAWTDEKDAHSTPPREH